MDSIDYRSNRSRSRSRSPTPNNRNRSRSRSSNDDFNNKKVYNNFHIGSNSNGNSFNKKILLEEEEIEEINNYQHPNYNSFNNINNNHNHIHNHISNNSNNNIYSPPQNCTITTTTTTSLNHNNNNPTVIRIKKNIKKDDDDIDESEAPTIVNSNMVYKIAHTALLCCKCKILVPNSAEELLKDTPNILLPSHIDKEYVYTCSKCNDTGKASLTHLPKSWKVIVHTSLYNLSIKTGQIFASNKDLCTYIIHNIDILLTSGKTTEHLNKNLSGILSSYKKLFISPVRNFWSMKSQYKDNFGSKKIILEEDEDDAGDGYYYRKKRLKLFNNNSVNVNSNDDDDFDINTVFNQKTTLPQIQQLSNNNSGGSNNSNNNINHSSNNNNNLDQDDFSNKINNVNSSNIDENEMVVSNNDYSNNNNVDSGDNSKKPVNSNNNNNNNNNGNIINNSLPLPPQHVIEQLKQQQYQHQHQHQHQQPIEYEEKQIILYDERIHSLLGFLRIKLNQGLKELRKEIEDMEIPELSGLEFRFLLKGTPISLKQELAYTLEDCVSQQQNKLKIHLRSIIPNNMLFFNNLINSNNYIQNDNQNNQNNQNNTPAFFIMKPIYNNINHNNQILNNNN